VEDATRDLTSESDDPIFPLEKRSWQGDLQYLLPVNVAPGFYKLRVQLFYNTRFNVEVPIALHVLTKTDMWQHNPLQVFGVPLDEVLRREGGQIPVAVSKALEVLCNEACLRVEGIFRMSGDLNKIMAMRDEMDSGKSPVFSSFISQGVLQGVHVVAGVLKLFFRSLPQPLLSEALYDELLTTHANVKNEPMATKVAAYKPLFGRAATKPDGEKGRPCRDGTLVGGKQPSCAAHGQESQDGLELQPGGLRGAREPARGQRRFVERFGCIEAAEAAAAHSPIGHFGSNCGGDGRRRRRGREQRELIIFFLEDKALY
jgi:hypothetical protein